MIEKKENVKQRLGFAASAALALALTGVCTSWAGAATVTAGYADGFTYSNGSTPTNFLTRYAGSGVTNLVNVQSNAFRYTLSGTAGSSTVLASSVVEASNLGGPAASALSFTLSSTLKLGSGTSTDINDAGNRNVDVGLAALGTGDAGGLIDAGVAAPTNFYWGGLVIAKSNAGGGFAVGVVTFAGNGFNLNSGVNRITINTDDTYQLTLTGTYVGSSLNLAFNVTDLDNTSNSVTLSFVDSSPLTGDFFGYRARTTPSSVGLNIQANFDNFDLAVVIPEPATATMSLGALAAAALVRRKRRTA